MHETAIKLLVKQYRYSIVLILSELYVFTEYLRTKVGFDIPFKKMKDESEVVFIATGFGNPRSTGTEGIDGKGCFQALDLLAKITPGEDIFIGRDIVIIGGCNVASDIARSLFRLRRKKYGKVQITLARLEKEGEMLADDEEIIQGLEEGITIKNARYSKSSSMSSPAVLKAWQR